MGNWRNDSEFEKRYVALNIARLFGVNLETKRWIARYCYGRSFLTSNKFTKNIYSKYPRRLNWFRSGLFHFLKDWDDRFTWFGGFSIHFYIRKTFLFLLPLGFLFNRVLIRRHFSIIRIRSPRQNCKSIGLEYKHAKWNTRTECEAWVNKNNIGGCTTIRVSKLPIQFCTTQNQVTSWYWINFSNIN